MTSLRQVILTLCPQKAKHQTHGGSSVIILFPKFFHR